MRVLCAARPQCPKGGAGRCRRGYWGGALGVASKSRYLVKCSSSQLRCSEPTVLLSMATPSTNTTQCRQRLDGTRGWCKARRQRASEATRGQTDARPLFAALAESNVAESTATILLSSSKLRLFSDPVALEISWALRCPRVCTRVNVCMCTLSFHVCVCRRAGMRGVRASMPQHRTQY